MKRFDRKSGERARSGMNTNRQRSSMAVDKKRKSRLSLNRRQGESSVEGGHSVAAGARAPFEVAASVSGECAKRAAAQQGQSGVRLYTAYRGR